MAARFTVDGSEALERQLETICQRVTEGVRSIVPARKIEGLCLGGGYGRGEGGVLRTAEGERPYNDLEFYLFLRGHPRWNERLFQQALHRFAEQLAPMACVEVEFKISALDEFQRQSITMFSYDLVMGHRWLLGDDALFRHCEAHRMARQIPLGEATRLLMNRCSGLLFAWERLQREPFTTDDADFVGRNLAKAQLGFGDAILTAHRLYHWSCRERHERLRELEPDEELSWLAEVQIEHAAGVDFKLHPVRTTAARQALYKKNIQLTQLGLLVWLWIESRRLGQPFAAIQEYVRSAMKKCPEMHRWRNLLINARTFGVRALLSAQALRYPRERLFHALALLLWEPMAQNETIHLRRLQEELFTKSRSFAELVAAYYRLWQQFN
jgi:hypothetical protein